ncbi:hypothetical protein A2617_04860 [Candidatus Daviesbacteria bacterium RIFOXYD1_FULL_41_10]|uniref:DUF2795 domain-containing protein n=3 Tax=Microgenomates group TaxID=1794810 RepID=A0A1F4ZWY9_9BACT|nr:MAG: hypothetical protein UU67_C0011G0010 [Candidatus Daviesbacteria bacterium GW2011_GWB1_41_5]OGD10800.1 MAG: hypothetical protein A2395_01385 [Candidatus Amesbacteria bacterium RIFOXYB1_FULL_47_9]OGE71975.1 MAG: hypothetical protein A2617_04860 [Candidatus Daviesbacteria bacterium RIFOXYD1_FULL_41_10]
MDGQTAQDMAEKMKEMITHLNEHIQYPASKQQIMEACNNMADVPEKDRMWLDEKLPEQTYQNVDEIKKVLMPETAA